MSKVPTPTLDRMLENKAESQAIGNFLEWLSAHEMFVAKYDPTRPRLLAFPIHDSTEQLLARYFEIDLTAAENEKRAILESLR